MKKFSIKSFGPAFKGILLTFAEPNFKFHVATSLLVVVGGILLQVSTIEWCLLIGCIGFVLTIEIINTAIEHIMNFLHPGFEERVGQIKDVAAAAVLISSITAFLVGSIIFLPKLLELFS